MTLEETIRQIVEQVLSQNMESIVGQKEAAETVLSKVEGDCCAVESQDGSLEDITSVRMQEYFKVPNPVDREFYQDMKNTTPAQIGVWRAGGRPLTDTLVRFRAAHATAQDAVLNDVSEAFIREFNLTELQSACRDKDEFLTRPDLGRKLCPKSMEILQQMGKTGAQVQIIVADGLSSTAVETNMPDLLPAFLQGLEQAKISTGTPLFVKYGRVAVMDAIGEALRPEVAIIMLGERPGLANAESLSAYLAYNPRLGMVESERTVVSNIHKGGTPAAEAGAHLVDIVKQILEQKCSGIKLTQR
ncbi:MAG: ethanolamine ammonia-lyase subunit EutC [Clostridia bacterium]|nr:ethanolamine ammonia-lyase subunit EutC [Clostridia bacterium]